MPARTKRKASASKGFSVKTFQGLNKTRMEKKSNANAGIRVAIKQGETVPVQFLTKPDEFTEFNQHSWKDGDRWYFVPCAGEGCPICQDEDRQRAKQSYRFAAVVYNLRDKKVQVLEGPKDLAGRIFYRYERKPSMFLKRTYDVTKFPTTPVTYDFAIGEDDLVALSTIKAKGKLVDIDAYLEGELKSFYGDDLPEGSAAVTEPDEPDDDEDDEDEDEEEVVYTLAQLKKFKLSKLRSIAEDMEIEDADEMDKSDLIEAIVAESEEDEDDDEDDEDDDTDDDDSDEDDDDDEDEEDDDEDEEDDDEDEDEDEDDDEPPAKKKPAAKKAPAKKAAKPAAKKTAARRR